MYDFKDHVSCIQINIEAKLLLTKEASIPKKKKNLETKCCLGKLCYTAFLKLSNSLFKTSLFCPPSQVATYIYLQVPNSLD